MLLHLCLNKNLVLSNHFKVELDEVQSICALLGKVVQDELIPEDQLLLVVVHQFVHRADQFLEELKRLQPLLPPGYMINNGHVEVTQGSLLIQFLFIQLLDVCS